MSWTNQTMKVKTYIYDENHQFGAVTLLQSPDVSSLSVKHRAWFVPDGQTESGDGYRPRKLADTLPSHRAR